jgi:hypothetical protein
MIRAHSLILEDAVALEEENERLQSIVQKNATPNIDFEYEQYHQQDQDSFGSPEPYRPEDHLEPLLTAPSEQLHEPSETITERMESMKQVRSELAQALTERDALATLIQSSETRRQVSFSATKK